MFRTGAVRPLSGRERDATLSMPRLILPAVQVNIRGGALPGAESNGTRYLKIPLNADITDFITAHQSRCSIVSGNLDVIILYGRSDPNG